MKAIISIVLLVVNIVLAAHVMLYMWGLFAMPLGAPAISVAHAYGILLLLQGPLLTSALSTAVTLNRIVPKPERDEAQLVSTVSHTAGWLMFALFAFVTSKFI